jgi:cell pole-organizing protein PopZ
MAKVSAAQEPSMEEILASIRRIISEDETGIAPIKPIETQAPVARPQNVSVSAADIDALFSARVHEITSTEPKVEPVRAEPRVEAPRSAPIRAEVAAPVAPTLSEPRMLRPPMPPITEMRRTAPVSEKPAAAPAAEVVEIAPLVSPATDAAVSAAFGSLANSVAAANARTVDDLVQEMLRPMLKDWLDTNLPTLVERLVREEIDRMSRGR